MLTQEDRDKVWAWLAGSDTALSRPELFKMIPRMLEEIQRLEERGRGLERLCKIYFEIAATAIPENQIRAMRDKRIAEAAKGKDGG